MGYSRSKKAVKKVLPILDLLLTAMEKGAKTIRLPTTNPNELAYAIRNALSVVKEYDGEFVKYKQLAETFKFSQERDHVIASRRSTLLTGDPVVELARSLERLTLDDVFGVFDVVGAIIEYKAPELEFPVALLSDEDIDTIKTFCANSGHEIINFNPLTIRKGTNGGTSNDATQRGIVNG